MNDVFINRHCQFCKHLFVANFDNLRNFPFDSNSNKVILYCTAYLDYVDNHLITIPEIKRCPLL